MKKRYDTRDNSKVVFGLVEEKQYKAELDLLDKFHLFSAELLRLSLLGITAFAFLFEKLFSGIDDRFPKLSFYLSPKWASGISVILFSFSAAFALAHRYFSTDAAGFYVHGLRIGSRILEIVKDQKEETLEEKAMEKASLEYELNYWMKRRGKWLTVCSGLKFLSALSLALGALLIGYAVFRLLVMHVAPVAKP